MPKVTRYAVPNKGVSQVQSMAAPTGGLNARDSLAMMKPDQAVQMVNWFPQQYGVRVRKGYSVHATGMPSPVETLMTYAGADGVTHLFAASGTSIYDITAAGPVGVAVAGPFGSDRWQWTNMTNEFGSFIIAVNGVDPPQVYNGTVWAALTITFPTEFPDMKAESFINVAIAHRRLWFVQVDSGDAWYLPVDLIQGAVARFGVGEVFPRGGFLQAIGTWATESGGGMKENTVFVSSQGDVAIFAGYDPDTVDLFNLAGVYRVGATFSRRCLQKYESDLLVLCEDGIQPLSNILSQTKVLMSGAITDIIQLRISTDVTAYAKEFGWQMLVVNRHQLVILNVPVVGQPHTQYVMNQITNAWCQFTGYDAVCWGQYAEEPYFGTELGTVMRAWHGNSDGATETAVGEPIYAYCQQAYSFFGNAAFQKRWTLMRPVFNAMGFPGLRVSVSVDFSLSDPIPGDPTAPTQQLGAIWNGSYWDEGFWVGGLQNLHNWYSVNQLGYCAATYLKCASNFDIFWISTDFVYEQGGVL